VGKRVVQRYREFSLRADTPKKVVAQSEEQIHIYRVTRTDGSSLWLEAEAGSLSGWAPAERVVPVEAAIALFTRQIGDHPKDSFPVLMRATLWHDRKEIGRAMADYTAAIRLDPQNGALYCNRGYLWGEEKEFDKAIVDFSEAIRLDPHDALAFLHRGHAWSEKQEHDKAIADFTRAIGLDPTDAYTFQSRGHGWFAKRDFDKAIADFTESIRLNPREAAAYHSRGLAWQDKKDADKALADFDQAIRLEPRAVGVYLDRGAIWELKKAYDKALADYDRAIGLDHKSAHAHFSRAVALFLARREGTAGDLRTMLELEGWRGELSLYAVLLGHFSAGRSGNDAQARKWLDDASAHCDTSAWPYPIVKCLRGELDEAKLMAAANDNDKMTEARCFLGLDWLQKGRKEAAQAHFRWVKEHGNPSFTEYAISIGELERLEVEKEQPRGR